jgi:transglutaminase-like putative cysteine protease
MIRAITFILFSIVSTFSFSQTDYASQLSSWKTKFPEEEFVAVNYNTIISFTLNANPKPGFGKVNALVRHEVTLVPTKDFKGFNDGLFYNQQVSIDNVKAINSKGKEIQLIKLCGSYQSEDIFHDDSKFCSVKFPTEEKGKAFTYVYEENYHDVKYLTSQYFHNSNPSIERTIEFRVPSWLELDLREFNFANYTITKATAKEGDINKISYKMKDVQAYSHESSAPNHALSYPHIISVSKAYTENGQRHVLFESVKDLYAWYRSICDSTGNDASSLKDKVNELTAGKKTDLDKIESLFYWVQDNIRYIAFEDGIMGFKPDAAQNVYRKKYGDCKGKANLLKELLKLAGFDARLTWIGTSDLPYDYSLPSLAVDNHMICTVIAGGKRYFLDGTEHFIALNDYAQRIQGKQVLIEDGKNYIIDKIPDFSAERNKMRSVTTLIIGADTLKGNTHVEYNGESKAMLQGVYTSIRNDKKKDALASFLSHGDDNLIVQNIKEPDFKERQKPIQVSFDFKANNQLTKAGNELYVVMDWNKEFSGLEFDDKRKNDYEFNNKYYLDVQTELMIPDGYKVDYLPSPLKRSTSHYSFEGSYTNNGKSILYKKLIVVNKPVLLRSEFEEWNKFIKEINTFYNDQVVLVKK